MQFNGTNIEILCYNVFVVARMAELVDAIDSKSIFRWGSLGSSPSASTIYVENDTCGEISH